MHCLLLAAAIVIPPLLESPVPVHEQLTWTPVLERAAAREVARVRLEPMIASDDAGALREGDVQLVDARLREGTSRIAIEGASAVRMRFAKLPGDAVVWVQGSDDEEPVRVTSEWGPTTHGSTVFVAAEGAIGDAAITAAAPVTSIQSDANACLEDVACPAASLAFDQVMDASRAVAYVRYVRNGTSYVCTGALVNDAAASRTPYLLTARHCIDSAETAASVEILWDLRSSACGSNRMAAYSRTYGAELLVASKETDVALLRLKSVPAGRVFLGIDTRALEAGTEVRRVSHAAGLSQTFAAGVIDDGARTCASAPRPQFVYSRTTTGGITSGSSGAPLLVNGLYVAGQLLGLCGADPTNACAAFNDMVDGAIRMSWPQLAPYLDPDAPRARRRAMR